MEINGEIFIPAPVQTVWDGLNNTDALAAAIPGCQSISDSGDNAYDVVAKLAVGPVRTTFRSKINVTDINAPHSYVLNFNSNGGVAGIANGKATVNLAEEDGGTRLRYNTDVQMGGKLAQIGGRLIQSTADKLSAQFFSRFSEYLSGGAQEESEETSTEKGLTKEQPVESAEPASVPGLSINIRISTLTLGILMFIIGCALGYLAAA